MGAGGVEVRWLLCAGGGLVWGGRRTGQIAGRAGTALGRAEAVVVQGHGEQEYWRRRADEALSDPWVAADFCARCLAAGSGW